MWAPAQKAVRLQGKFSVPSVNRKLIIFLQVNVNGNDYMPTVAVDNKKKAKSNAAMACLQQMGLVPKDPDNPV